MRPAFMVMNTHGLVFICLVAAYLLVNVLAAISSGWNCSKRHRTRSIALSWGNTRRMGKHKLAQVSGFRDQGTEIRDRKFTLDIDR